MPYHPDSKDQITKISNIFKTGGIYKIITTCKRLNDEAELLTLIETAPWDTSYTTGLIVNKTEAGKIMPNIAGKETKNQKEFYEIIQENGLHSKK